MLRAQEDRDKIRQAKAQMQQQAAAAEQAAQMQMGAQTAKTLAETPVQQQEANALDALLGSFGGGA